MLDASLVIIEVISTNPRAPSVERQMALIRKDGTVPDRRFDAPDALADLPFLLRRDDGDVVAVAHPKALGTPKQARAVLEAIARAEATVKLPEEDPINLNTPEARDAFLARIAATPWGKGSQKQLRNPGRPTKHKQPNEQQRATYERMWFAPETYKPRHILALASEELGRNVEYWELKHWFGPGRTRPES